MKTHVIDSCVHRSELTPQAPNYLELIYASSPITIWDEIPRAVWPMPQVIGEAEMSVRRQVAENMGMEFVTPTATELEEYARRDAWWSADYSWLERRVMAWARGSSKEGMKRDAFAASYGMSSKKIKEQGVRHVGTVRNDGRLEFSGSISGRFSAGQFESLRGPSPRENNPPG